MKRFISVVLLETKNLTTGIKTIEETFLQVLATGIEDAKEKSESYGHSCETVYKNSLQEDLKISFIKVDDVNDVLRSEYSDNVKELYSRSKEL